MYDNVIYYLFSNEITAVAFPLLSLFKSAATSFSANLSLLLFRSINE